MAQAQPSLKGAVLGHPGGDFLFDVTLRDQRSLEYLQLVQSARAAHRQICNLISCTSNTPRVWVPPLDDITLSTPPLFPDPDFWIEKDPRLPFASDEHGRHLLEQHRSEWAAHFIIKWPSAFGRPPPAKRRRLEDGAPSPLVFKVIGPNSTRVRRQGSSTVPTLSSAPTLELAIGNSVSCIWTAPVSSAAEVLADAPSVYAMDTPWPEVSARFVKTCLALSRLKTSERTFEGLQKAVLSGATLAETSGFIPVDLDLSSCLVPLFASTDWVDRHWHLSIVQAFDSFYEELATMIPHRLQVPVQSSLSTITASCVKNIQAYLGPETRQVLVGVSGLDRLYHQYENSVDRVEHWTRAFELGMTAVIDPLLQACSTGRFRVIISGRCVQERVKALSGSTAVRLLSRPATLAGIHGLTLPDVDAILDARLSACSLPPVNDAAAFAAATARLSSLKTAAIARLSSAAVVNLADEYALPSVRYAYENVLNMPTLSFGLKQRNDISYQHPSADVAIAITASIHRALVRIDRPADISSLLTLLSRSEIVMSTSLTLHESSTNGSEITLESLHSALVLGGILVFVEVVEQGSMRVKIGGPAARAALELAIQRQNDRITLRRQYRFKTKQWTRHDLLYNFPAVFRDIIAKLYPRSRHCRHLPRDERQLHNDLMQALRDLIAAMDDDEQIAQQEVVVWIGPSKDGFVDVVINFGADILFAELKLMALFSTTIATYDLQNSAVEHVHKRSDDLQVALEKMPSPAGYDAGETSQSAGSHSHSAPSSLSIDKVKHNWRVDEQSPWQTEYAQTVLTNGESQMGGYLHGVKHYGFRDPRFFKSSEDEQTTIHGFLSLVIGRNRVCMKAFPRTVIAGRYKLRDVSPLFPDDTRTYARITKKTQGMVKKTIATWAP